MARSNQPLVAMAVLGSAMLASWLVACRGTSPDPGTDVALFLDRDAVPYKQFERYLARNGGTGDTPVDMPSDLVLGRLFDRFVDEELLVRMAVGAGFDGDRADTQDHRAPIGFLLDRALGREAVSPDQVATYFVEHQESFQQPERVHLWQILVTRRSLAARTLVAIRDGEPFPDAARRVASDPDANFCGDQGLLGSEDLPPSFAGPIFALEPGEVSEVLRTDSGFYLFWLEERIPPASQRVEDVASEIREILRRTRLEEIESALLQEARARYTVRVFAANLPFEYQGSYAENG